MFALSTSFLGVRLVYIALVLVNSRHSLWGHVLGVMRETKAKEIHHFRKRFKQDKIFSFSWNYLRISSLTALRVRDGTQDVASPKPEAWPCCYTISSVGTVGCSLSLSFKPCQLTLT